ncbi:MAG: DUF3795 domain-containing protein [Oscillospiraceae bacterium]
MRGFSRKEPMFSLCGLNCALCAMHVGGYCPGCGGGEGNQSCAIARCSLGRGVEFCADCAEYPCARYEGFDDADSFVPHSRRRADLERARELGLEAYMSELREKAELLSELLAGYNDGRRKSLSVPPLTSAPRPPRSAASPLCPARAGRKGAPPPPPDFCKPPLPRGIS